MDLLSRKYSFIEAFIKLDDERVLVKLEEILGRERRVEGTVSEEDRQVLGERLEEYKKNPGDVLSWDEMIED